MKNLVLIIVLMSPIFAVAEDYYTAIKSAVGSTPTRINAGYREDYATACVNTKTYVEAFKALNDPTIWKGLNQEYGGPYYVLMLDKMQELGLPTELHNACNTRDKAAVKKVLSRMSALCGAK